MDVVTENQLVKKKRRVSKKMLYGAALVLIIAAGISSSWYFYSKYQYIRNNPAQASQESSIDLKNKVAKLITVPESEVPTIATIQDIDKLKEQTFFKDAQNSDKVLIFTEARQAIIYRESSNKLINVGPISLDQDSQ